MFGFGKAKKAPSEVVKALGEALEVAEKKKESKNLEKHLEKASQDAAKCLSTMKGLLYGEEGSDVDPQHGIELSELLASGSVLPLVFDDLLRFPFESRKDLVLIVASLLKKENSAGRNPIAEFFVRHPEIAPGLLKAYVNPELYLCCGSILREMIKNESVCESLLNMETLRALFEYVDLKNFDVATDAYLTLRDLLTRHHAIVTPFLEKNYDALFATEPESLSLCSLLLSSNYVTRRQTIRFLGEILLDRANYTVMTRFIMATAHLKSIMNLLRDKSKNIQFEAFQLFKLFVANPNRPENITVILRRNKPRLIEFFSNFQKEKDKNDLQFEEEKGLIVEKISELPDFDPNASSAGTEQNTDNADSRAVAEITAAAAETDQI